MLLTLKLFEAKAGQRAKTKNETEQEKVKDKKIKRKRKRKEKKKKQEKRRKQRTSWSFSRSSFSRPTLRRVADTDTDLSSERTHFTCKGTNFDEENTFYLERTHLRRAANKDVSSAVTFWLPSCG